MSRLPCRASAMVLILLPGLLVATIAVFSAWRGVAPHVDEEAWIGSGYYFELLWRGDFTHPDWQLLPARESPPVGMYVFGLATRIAGHPVLTIEPLAGWYERWRQVPGAWGSGTAAADRAEVAERLGPAGRIAIREGRYRALDDRAIWAARAAAAAFGIACAVGIALLGCACRRPATGAFAGSLFAVHPVAIESYTHALVDVIGLAFSTFAVLAVIHALRAGPDFGRRVSAPAAGVLIGLAVGTKLNALIVVALVVALLVALAASALARRREAGRRCAAMALALCLAAIVFVAINPRLHPDVTQGVLDLLDARAQTAIVQAGFLPGYLVGPGARLEAVARLVCGRPEVFAGLVALALGVSWSGRWRLDASSITAAWWWIGLAAVSLWIPFPWARYALPLVPPGAVLVAIAAADATAWVGHRARALPRGR